MFSTFAVVRLRLFSCQWKSVALQLWNFLRRVSLELEWCLCLKACHPLIPLSFSCDQKFILSFSCEQKLILYFSYDWKDIFVSSHFVPVTIIWFSAQTGSALLHSATCFFAPMNPCNPPECKTIQRKISQISSFEFFSRSSVATFNEDRISFGDNKLLLSCMVLPSTEL